MTFLDSMLDENYIENTKGGLYFPSTFNDNLDYFTYAGSRTNSFVRRFGLPVLWQELSDCRKGEQQRKEKSISALFERAYNENRETALANLLYTLDIRSGKGERDIFRFAFVSLCRNHPEDGKLILKFIPSLGRWDYLFYAVDTDVEEEAFHMVKDQLMEDLDNEHPSLLAKWMPSLRTHNTRNPMADRIRHYLGMSEKEYRKTLSSLREKISLVETKLTEKDYGSISYEAVPTKAMLKYEKAFERNDKKNYSSYLASVSNGEKKINTEGLFCYEIVRKILHNRFADGKAADSDLYDLMWKNQKNLLEDDKSNALVICDVSGSMMDSNFLPLANSIGLGLYIAERNHGMFHDYVMTFSDNPQLIKVTGETITEKVNQVLDMDWGGTTAIDKAFNRILSAAKRKNCPQEDMPSRIYIISDMEFDQCTDGTQVSNFRYWKKKYEEAGYTLPNIVFWNVAAKMRGCPVNKNDTGCVSVSGFSTNILSSLKNIEEFSPIPFMLQTLQPYFSLLFRAQ